MISARIVDEGKLHANAEGYAKIGLDGRDGVSCTHEWEGTVLHVTSASGTTSADLKGDKGNQGVAGYTPVKGVDYFDGKDGYTPQKNVDYFDGKDGTSVTVTNVSTSTADGGSNVVTFSDGTKLTVMNGTKGANGTMTFEELTPEQKASLKGEDGKDGTSVTISKITESTADGGSNVVTFSDGETMTVKNGSRGEKGDSGVYVGDGDMPEGYNVQIIPDGTPDYDPGSGTGESGATFIPSVSEDGVISWTNDKGLSNPTPVDISGKDGKDGTSVTVSRVSESSIDGGSNVVTFSDGKTLTIKNGNKGNTGAPGYTPQKNVDYFDGKDGKDGVSATHSWNGTVLSITSASGTSSADLRGADGAQGERGTGILKVTTSPSSYSTAIGSYTPKYRIALSTVKTQSGVNEVLIGDLIQYSYYHYLVDYLDSSYAYISVTRTSLRGSAGTSITVSDTTESTEDGGSNVVTFSDGTTLTVQNGSKGSKGDKGDTYTLTSADKVEIRDEIISSVVTQEAGQSTNLVMSQKAVTDLVADAIGSGGGGTSTEYETVDSVDEMTDTSKQYVLKETGTIWAYGEKEVEKEPENKLVPSKATLNQRLSGSSGSVSANNNAIGSFITDFIAVSDLDSISPYNVRLNWVMPLSEDNKIVYYNSSKTRVGNTIFSNGSTFFPNTTISNGEAVIDIKKANNGSTDAPNGSWADIAYIRLQLFVKPVGTSLTSDDIANLTITFVHEGGTTIISEWYDTGLTPSASGGGNYVELLVKVNQNKTDIEEVSNRVTALETGSDTVTVPTFWQSAVDVCISKIKALQIGRNCVTFPFFSDNHQRNGYSGMLIAHVMKECHIPYAFFGGDSIDSGYIASEAVMIAQDKAFDTAMSYIPNGRFCRAVGNHDGYWAVDANNKNYYTDAQNYELFLREESIAQNKHFGGDGTYYYVDDIASKTRWIVLDTNDGTVEQEQISWLQNTALSFSDSGWAVVFISHQPISNHYHANISNAEAVRTVVANYVNGTATNKADIVGWYSGHIHRDRIYTGVAKNTTDDSVGAAMPFKQITITSDHTGIAYDDATKHTVANDDKSHAIDFVTINKSTRTVNITRLGIGSDRSYTY